MLLTRMEVRPSFLRSMLCESAVTPTAVGFHRRVPDDSLTPVAVACKSTTCGDPLSEPTIFICPLCEPESVGAHTTARVQVPSGANVLPCWHWSAVLASSKSGETAMLVIVAGAVLL